MPDSAPGPAMTPIDAVVAAIEVDQCGNCKYRYQPGMPIPLLRCRRFPPVTVSVAIPNPEPDPAKRPEHEKGDWVVREFSSFAIAAFDEWCGEHVRGDPHGTIRDMPPAPEEPKSDLPPATARPALGGRRKSRRVTAPF